MKVGDIVTFKVGTQSRGRHLGAYILIDIDEYVGTITLKERFPANLTLPIECLDLLEQETELSDE